jgi:replicative DNA helicase
MMNSSNGKTFELPFSEDAEKGLICSLLRGGDRVAVELAVPLPAFYIPAHRIIWETLCDLVVEKRPLDFVIVKNRLVTLRQLEEVGGPGYVNDLYTFVPTWENYRFYAKIVQENYRFRTAILGTQGMLMKLRERGKASWDEVRGEIETDFSQMLDDSDDEEITTKELTMQWLDELQTRKERLLREGIGFGLEALDKRLGMQQPGEVVTIGAQTSTGKSLLAYQGVAYNIGVKRLPVGVISLEMTYTQTWDRLASHMKTITMDAFRSGEFTGEDYAKLAAFGEKMMTEMPFYFSQKRVDIDRIKSWARRQKTRHGIKLLVVDYLQRVSVPRRIQKHSRQEQVAYVSNELKNLALDLNIVIWCPVQLNKEDEVRESAAIQFDADIAIRIKTDTGSYTSAEIRFDKVRQGNRGEPIPIWIKGWTQTIEYREAA